MSDADLSPPPISLFPAVVEGISIKRRRRLDPLPRFKADRTRQLNGIEGCAALQVPSDHLAKQIWALIGALDTSAMDLAYSSLGRHGFEPKRVLAVWTYASATGVHHASKVERAMVTDAAYRFLSGGYTISAETLCSFRRRFAAVYDVLSAQLLEKAVASGVVEVTDLSVDSVRIEAHASMKAVRTLERSARRLEELSHVDRTALSDAQKLSFDARVLKHRAGVERCQAEGRTNLVLTSPTASLLKFPYGAAKPGHRVSAVVAGQVSRFIVWLYIDGASCDYGKLEPLMNATRAALKAAGVPDSTQLQVAADAGYFSATDLTYSANNRSIVDVLVPEPPPSLPKKPGYAKELKFFGRDKFVIAADLTATCPAGTPMTGPNKDQEGITTWFGVGCPDCPLLAQCTIAKRRKLTVRTEYERGKTEMAARMAEPGARTRYNRRISTVEPVFSYIEDVMRFRRVSSRSASTIEGELKLKVLTYNLLRLHAAADRARALSLVVEETSDTVRVRLNAVETPRAGAEP